METLVKQILETLEARKKAGAPNAIGCASDFVAHMGSCVNEPNCAARFGVDAAAWQRGMEACKGTLAFWDEELVTEGGVWLVDSGAKAFGCHKDRGAEYVKGRKEPVAGSIMDFDYILTSTRKDRDRDILECEGCEIDPKMPFLWQHMPMLPIGRHVEEVGRTAKKVKCRAALADLPLAHDAAVLIEFEALRISHGFKPKKIEPLEREKGDDSPYPPGWHILQFEVMESSAVSIPSNVDAVILAFSRAKLAHPLAKAWAKGLWDEKPERAVSGWNPDAGPAPEVKACGCGKGKAPEPQPIKGRMSKGDMDKLSSAIEHCEAAIDHADAPRPFRSLVEKGHGCLKSVMDRHAAADAEEADKPGKAPKRVTRADVEKLKDAVDHLDEAKSYKGLKKGPKAFAEKAFDLASDMHTRHSPGDEPDEGGSDQTSTDDHATRVIASFYAGKPPSKEIALQLYYACDEYLKAAAAPMN